MIATNKKQITLKALTNCDEIKTYTLGDRVNKCVKMRIIDGKKVFIEDSYRAGVLTSTNFNSLKELKSDLQIAHF